MRAIEIGGRIDERHRLHLDAPLEVAGPSRVRVLVLIPEEGDLSEAEWLRMAAANPAFDFLREPSEDIYTPQDGKPLRNEG